MFELADLSFKLDPARKRLDGDDRLASYMQPLYMQ